MAELIDLSGQRFGRLTVRQFAGKDRFGGRLWECICDCGKTVVVHRSNLGRGSMSCGCARTGKLRVDLAGKRFSKLTAVRFIGRDDTGKAQWECLCDCGSTCAVAGPNLSSGMTKSCGCLKAETLSLPPGAAAFNKRYSACKHSAKKRGIEFSLSKEQYHNIVTQPCSFCGRAPSPWNPYLYADGKVRYKHMSSSSIERAWIHISSVDRIDSKKGYVFENCQPLCVRHNYMKAERTLEELLLEDILPMLRYAGFEIVKKKGGT